MKKQSGFTLIELMVVMAIIAILATAGLSAYTGYIKKARDATRIADIQALNTIVLGDTASDGLPPADQGALNAAVLVANNGQALTDPIGLSTCLATGDAGATSTGLCSYIYTTCNSGTNYRITAKFESSANRFLYNRTLAGADCSAAGAVDCVFYGVGSC